MSPPRKRRRPASPAEMDEVEDVEEVPPNQKNSAPAARISKKNEQKRKPKDSKNGMRNMLAAFVRPGSQLPKETEKEESEDEGEDEQEEESGSEQEEHKETETGKGKEMEVEVESAQRNLSVRIDLTEEDQPDDTHVTVPVDPMDVESTPSSQEIVMSSEADLPTLDETSLASEDPSQPVLRPEIIRHTTGDDLTIRVNIPTIARRWSVFRSRLSNEGADERMDVDPDEPSPRMASDAGLQNVEDEEKAANALARIIEKRDFARMEIIGQFNLGFIVARRRIPSDNPLKPFMDDLFIIDQHAADEKYNFEDLQQTTLIRSQRLLRRVVRLNKKYEATDSIIPVQATVFGTDCCGRGYRFRKYGGAKAERFRTASRVKWR